MRAVLFRLLQLFLSCTASAEGGSFPRQVFAATPSVHHCLIRPASAGRRRFWADLHPPPLFTPGRRVHRVHRASRQDQVSVYARLHTTPALVKEQGPPGQHRTTRRRHPLGKPSRAKQSFGGPHIPSLESGRAYNTAKGKETAKLSVEVPDRPIFSKIGIPIPPARRIASRSTLHPLRRIPVPLTLQGALNLPGRQSSNTHSTSTIFDSLERQNLSIDTPTFSRHYSS